MDIFIQWLIANSLKGAVLIVAIFLVQFVFSKQIPPKWKYLMWLLVALRLIMPSLLELDSSIFNLTNLWQSEPVSFIQVATAPQNQVAIIEESSMQAAPIDVFTAEKEIELSTIVFSLWAAVSSFLFLYLLWKNLSLLALVRKEKPIIKSEWLELLESCKRELKLYTPVQLIETRHIKSPALMGCIRPRILLPEGILNVMTESEIRLIFMHELSHLKGGDIIINWTMSLIQIVHWFNPLVWIAFAKAREARELACDDDMLYFLGKNKSKKYGQTIIRLLDLCCNENKVTGMVGILENKKQINRRIKMITKYNKKTKKGVVFALILLAVMGTVFLSEAKEKKNTTEIKKDDNVASTYAKLERIIFPNIQFDDADIFSVVRFLNRLSKRCDPDKVGVTVIAGFDKEAGKNIKATMGLSNIPMSEVLRYLCDSHKLKYTIQEGAVIISLAAKGTKTKNTAAQAKRKGKSALDKKLKSIIIPRLDYEDITVDTAVRHLRVQSKQLDPKGVGVNIILNISDKTSKSVVNLVLEKRNLYQCLYFLCKTANLKLRIDKYAVVISD